MPASRAVRPKDCHERALGLLAVRARSRRELERRLLDAGFPDDEVAAELSRLESVGLIDDEDFARQLARHAFGTRGSGARAVTGALAAKGVPHDVITTVVAEFDRDPEARAETLARSKARSLAGLDPAKAFTRLSGLLMRRGYDPSTARTVARRVLAPDATGDD
ncbi:MAG TPA: regulatory protein RecX [Actinomycetota bacterium]